MVMKIFVISFKYFLLSINDMKYLKNEHTFFFKNFHHKAKSMKIYTFVGYLSKFRL